MVMRLFNYVNFRSTVCFIFFLIIGTTISFYPTLFSSFRSVQAGLGDDRFNNYLLEHTYLWLKSAPLHNTLWDLPVYYPVKNTFAYSDILMGSAPIYWIFRTLFKFDTSYQLWLISVATLNYVTMYVFLSKCLKYSTFASCMGAFIFSYSLPRTIHISHAQLISQYYVIISLIGLYNLFQKRKKLQWIWLLLFVAGIILQIITGWYLAFFWCFSLFISFLILFFYPKIFRSVLSHFIRNIFYYFFFTIISCIVLFPIFSHYYQASKTIGYFSFNDIFSFLPHLASWLYTGPYSFAYSDISKSFSLFKFDNPKELVLNTGYVTTFLFLYSAVKKRDEAFHKLLILTFIILVIVTLIIPFTHFSFWAVLSKYLPLIRSIRAVSRIILILLIPISIWIADFFQNIKSKKIIILLTLVIILEQIQILPFYDKYDNRKQIQTIVSKIPEDCLIFYYLSSDPNQIYKSQIDGMWAGMVANKYTINGYASKNPPHYGILANNVAKGAEQNAILMGKFNQWNAQHSLLSDSTCVVYL